MNYSNYDKDQLINLGFLVLLLTAMWIAPVIIK